MAQAQLLRQKQKQELAVLQQQEQKLAQAVQQQQSLQMVQTFLGASIGSLVYLRGLFPDQCFTKMLYTHELAEDYSKFCDAPEVDPRHPGTKFTRLQKGMSKKVDSFLSLLEGGVFKAIKDKYLKAMQVYITSEKDNVDTVIESYTFTFAYLENGVSLSLGGHEVTVGNASQSAENLTRRLLTITEDLSLLPNHIWLSIQLHYTDDTPNGYTVPGFNRLGIGAPNLVMQGEAVRRWACGRMDSGFHGISLNVASIYGKGNSDKNAKPDPRRGRRVGTKFFVDEDVDEPLEGTLRQFRSRSATTVSMKQQQDDIVIIPDSQVPAKNERLAREIPSSVPEFKVPHNKKRPRVSEELSDPVKRPKSPLTMDYVAELSMDEQVTMEEGPSQSESQSQIYPDSQLDLPATQQIMGSRARQRSALGPLRAM